MHHFTHAFRIFFGISARVFFTACLSDNDYGLVWKVEGYDDRYPGDLSLFSRVGVYGTLKRNNIHDMYIGACEYIGPLVQ